MSGRGRGQKMNSFGESIYDLIPKKEAVVQKAPRYTSKYPGNTAPTASTFGPSTGSACMTTNVQGDYALEGTSHNHKLNGATFGRQSDHYADPTAFLQKSQKGALNEPKPFQYKYTMKPAIVRKEEKPIQGRRSNTNFIRENAVATIMSEPKVKNVAEPQYARKPDFGKVPAYLSNVKAEIAAEQEYIASEMEATRAYYNTEPQMQLLEETERCKLLQKLKKKWELINKKYQNSTHVVTLDTVGKVRRKEDYESNLHQLEVAIEKLSKEFVFVQVANQYAGWV